MTASKHSILLPLLVAVLCFAALTAEVRATKDGNLNVVAQGSVASSVDVASRNSTETSAESLKKAESLVSDHSKSSTSPTRKSVAKEYRVFSHPIPSAMGCHVCYMGLMSATVQLKVYMVAKGKNSVSSAEVSELLENMCNPHHISGAWLHRIELHLNKVNHTLAENAAIEGGEGTKENREEKAVSAVFREYMVYNTVCKRTCKTAADACEHMMETEVYDDFANTLSEIPLQDLENETIHLELRAKYCNRFTQCEDGEKIMENLDNLLNRPNSKWRKEIEDDRVEYVNDLNEQRDMFSRKQGLLTKLSEEEVERLRIISETHFEQQMMRSQEMAREEEEEEEAEDARNKNLEDDL